MKSIYLSLIAVVLSLSLTFTANSQEIIPVQGSWELTRVENLDPENRSFKAPNWVGSVFHFSANGNLILENQEQFYLTTFQQDGQSLTYEEHTFEIDRQFKDYWTFLFVDETAQLDCRLHFVPTEATLEQVPRQSVTDDKSSFPLIGSVPEPIQKTDGEIYKVVEQMPRFPGCEDVPDAQERKQCAQQELLKFIYSNLSYPAEARQNKTQGTAVVTFVVEEDGSTSGFRIVRDLGDGCGEAALEVVNQMNEQGIIWTPGTRNGEPVRVQFNLPIKFRVM